MILRLMLQGLRHGKARFACATAGIALAVFALLFTAALVATNDAQAPYLARQACVPWSAWKAEASASADLTLETLAVSVDYRPGGHVLQGPPMRALVARAPAKNPYGAVRLAEGRWVDETASACEVVCVRRTMRRFGRAPAPALGETVKFVARQGTMTARIVGYLDGAKLPREFPAVFANGAAFAAFASEEKGGVSFFATPPADGSALTADDARVIGAFKPDEQRRMDYARPLLFVAALLTALTLLVNSLLLSVEANRPALSTLRVIGLTRGGVVAFVTLEALAAGLVGWLVGVALAGGGILLWVALDPATFPAGAAFGFARLRVTLLALPAVTLLAVLFALAPALKVRPLDAEARRPRPRRRGMAITFACGFAAFVAVEVWGASLMRGFVPSAEWPDAIVSILPGGVSSFDVEKLRGIEGVRRVSELMPLQLFLAGKASDGPRRPNALFLAAAWLPRFRFVEGDWASAEKALRSSDAVVITEMMSRAHTLHAGDRLAVTIGRGPSAQVVTLPVAGVVDLNWHMVTSRGLVRGLNGAPPMTDGPVFCSFDTLESLDLRPSPMVKMTHLWVEYEPSFLARHGVFPAGRRIEAEIVRRLGDPVASTVRLHARDEIADGTLSHGSSVIGQAARVPFVFLAILAIGFVAMLVAEADARRREFAVLRAVGATRGQVARRLVASAVKTALAGMAAGLPVGALVGWLASLKTGAMWPGLPHWFVLPWQVVLEGAAGALVFALVFAVPTALRLVRSNQV